MRLFDSWMFVRLILTATKVNSLSLGIDGRKTHKFKRQYLYRLPDSQT